MTKYLLLISFQSGVHKYSISHSLVITDDTLHLQFDSIKSSLFIRTVRIELGQGYFTL